MTWPSTVTAPGHPTVHQLWLTGRSTAGTRLVMDSLPHLCPLCQLRTNQRKANLRVSHSWLASMKHPGPPSPPHPARNYKALLLLPAFEPLTSRAGGHPFASAVSEHSFCIHGGPGGQYPGRLGRNLSESVACVSQGNSLAPSLLSLQSGLAAVGTRTEPEPGVSVHWWNTRSCFCFVTGPHVLLAGPKLIT